MKHVSILVPEGEGSLIDVIGAYKAFRRVNQYLEDNDQDPMFTVQLVGASRNMSIEGGLFSVHPHLRLEEVERTDLIIIPAISWNFSASLARNQALLPWIVQQYRQGAEVASMCIGGFLLAATGLLNGKSCSTHWMAADVFRRMFPEVNLVVEKVITDEQGIYTNGGAFSFVNLLLYLIEKYCGRKTAIYCSKVFEVDIDRNCQSPFTMFSGLKDHQDEEIKRAQLFIENNVDKKISIGQLATQFGIGRRNFDRRFIKATHNTPAEYLQRVKIEAAKKMLETSRKTVNEVMYEVGYIDLKAFREVFKRITGLSPLEYRNKYNKEAVVL
ncbi:helix-turn-helix domain-containing protein [Chitinophaga agrisoli]|uniref:Helix-turn-helix domain-containing protein n=2 Tax=Chitinophaga agrisoli TaxID=2607653 RepID=A0A5B2VRV5_9BACT|nr:helix-turn-helix domain-containing protein [Chitinophaga agrisoli]